MTRCLVDDLEFVNLFPSTLTHETPVFKVSEADSRLKCAAFWHRELISTFFVSESSMLALKVVILPSRLLILPMISLSKYSREVCLTPHRHRDFISDAK